LSGLEEGEPEAKFGAHRAHTRAAALEGKLSEGEQNGQENLEEVEEDPSDEAVAGTGSQTHSVGLFLIGRSALKDTTRPETRIPNGKWAAASMATALFLRARLLNFDGRVLKFSTGDD
jgi:hypothetical protein